MNTGRDHPGPVIEVENLTKAFRSRFRKREVQALRDVSLRVERSEVVAFLGPNGAGKTTTIYAMLGLLRPDQGRVRLFGRPAGSPEARRLTGFQSEIFYTYGFKTAERVLRFYGELSELSSATMDEAVPRQLARIGLDQARARKVSGFSKGMVQRLGLAQALLHEPELLILDEPTTGLDPEGRKLVAEIILEQKARGTTVFLSSHILSDVERTCDHIVILNQGRVAYSASMASLQRDSDDWEIEAVNREAGVPTAVAGADIRQRADGVFIIKCRTADKHILLRRLLDAKADIMAVRRGRSLEDLYMQYAGGTSSG
jgi:ABC-2 type transport system ATP-binding protein